MLIISRDKNIFPLSEMIWITQIFPFLHQKKFDKPLILCAILFSFSQSPILSPQSSVTSKEVGFPPKSHFPKVSYSQILPFSLSLSVPSVSQSRSLSVPSVSQSLSLSVSSPSLSPFSVQSLSFKSHPPKFFLPLFNTLPGRLSAYSRLS